VTPTQKRPKLVDVAKLAGTSVATASRALSGTGYVAPKTRSRVEKAIRDLHYQPNLRARGLRQRSSRSIGLIVPDLLNAYYTALADAVSQALSQRGYHLHLAFTRDDIALERDSFLDIIGQAVDGLIWVPTGPDKNLLRQLHTQHIPAVSIVRRVPEELPAMDTVVFADYEGSYAATQHLIGLGHQRIGFVGGDVRYSSNFNRRQGYLAALKAAGLPGDESLVKSGMPRSTWGNAATIDLLRMVSPPTAIFAASNAIMPGVVKMLRHYGAAVPNDMSLICFDDVDWFSFSVPPITAISCNHAHLAEAAVDLLMQRIEAAPGANQPPVSLEIPFELVLRNSTAAPRHGPLALSGRVTSEGDASLELAPLTPA
jgi:LacI family transcriptional regulator